MSSQNSSHFMRRLVALKGSRQNRTNTVPAKSPASNTPTHLASPAQPVIELHSENTNPLNVSVEPTVTYHSNFLGLFQADGETPIHTTVPPKLTDLVPPIDISPESPSIGEGAGFGFAGPSALPSRSKPPRPRQIEDLDYVGGWGLDEHGKQQYVARGHIEEVVEEDDGEELGGGGGSATAGTLRVADAFSLPANATPPPRPLRTGRELPQSPLVPDTHHRFQHPRLSAITRTPGPSSSTHFISPLSQSISSLPPLTGFSHYESSPNPVTSSQTGLHFTFPNVADPPLRTPTEVEIEIETETEHEPEHEHEHEPLADSLSSLPPLRGFHHLPPTSYPNSDRITEEEEEEGEGELTIPDPEPDPEPPKPMKRAQSRSRSRSSRSQSQSQPRPSKRARNRSQSSQSRSASTTSSEPASASASAGLSRDFEALGNSLESLSPPQPSSQLEPQSRPQRPQIEIPPPIFTVPLYHSPGTETDERIVEQNISSIEEIERLVSGIRNDVSSLRPIRNVQPILDMCDYIEQSLSRIRQTLIRRRTLPQEHWSHLSVSSRSKYENRLLSLQRCLRRLSDMTKRIVEPSRLDTFLRKLGQHYEKLTNVADKLDDTFERLRLRHLYAVASKLTEEANKHRSTYMSAREMYVLRKSKSRNGLNRSRSRVALRRDWSHPHPLPLHLNSGLQHQHVQVSSH